MKAFAFSPPCRVVLFTTLLLAACEGGAAFAERTCGSRGLSAGSPAYQQCVNREIEQMRVENERQQRSRASIPSVY